MRPARKGPALNPCCLFFHKVVSWVRLTQLNVAYCMKCYMRCSETSRIVFNVKWPDCSGELQSSLYLPSWSKLTVKAICRIGAALQKWPKRECALLPAGTHGYVDSLLKSVLKDNGLYHSWASSSPWAAAPPLALPCRFLVGIQPGSETVILISPDDFTSRKIFLFMLFHLTDRPPRVTVVRQQHISTNLKAH